MNPLRFSLDLAFLNSYKERRPDWGPLGEFVYLRTYARTKADGTIESWWETVQRVVEGIYQVQYEHCAYEGLPWSWDKAQESAQVMYDLIFTFKFLPPGRGLWMMGTSYVKERGGACLNNCSFVSTKDIDIEFALPFSFAMDMLMVGVGIGFDTRGAGKVMLESPEYTEEVYVVEDTREGWVELIHTCISAFCNKGKRQFPRNIDTSKVRKQGAPIRGFGGVASGPEPLLKLVQDIHSILSSTYTYISSSQIVDLMNAIAKCVIAGNVRRSAEIAFGIKEDIDFSKLKNWSTLSSGSPYPTPAYAVAGGIECPNCHTISEVGQDYCHNEKCMENGRQYFHGPQTWRFSSNNSMIAEVGMDYQPFIESIAQNGEPGFLWLQHARDYGRMGKSPDYQDSDVEGSNPCGEISLSSYELCNLCETFPSRHESYEEYERTLKYAYLYAKTVSLIRTHHQRTNSAMLKNRRIGMSQTGIIPAINKLGLKEYLRWCDSGFDYLRKLDAIYSDWLCVPRSKKITTVKPSGTVSLLPGVPAGIHYPHSEYYIRRIRVSAESPFVSFMRDRGYPVETDRVSANTAVISFPVKEAYYSRGKAEVSIWEQMSLAAKLQKYWADNQVSITVTFKKSEVGDIARALAHFETELKAISFLPLNDHGYVQAPYERIDAATYEILTSRIQLQDLTREYLEMHEITERFCDGDACTI